MEDRRFFSDIRHQMQATHGFAMDGKKHIYDDGNCYDYLKMNWGWGRRFERILLNRIPNVFQCRRIFI